MPVIEYIGKKECAPDLHCGSGKTWMGKGTRHEVTPAAAARLLKFPTEWALVEEKGKGRKPAPAFVAPETDPERMDDAELRDHAMTNFKHSFPARASAREMRDEIASLAEGREPLKQGVFDDRLL